MTVPRYCLVDSKDEIQKHQMYGFCYACMTAVVYLVMESVDHT